MNPKIQWPPHTSKVLVDVWEKVKDRLPEDVTVYADTSGWQLSLQWEDGIGFPELARLLADVEGEWDQDTGTRGVYGSGRSTIHFTRTPHPLTAAYSLMAAEQEQRCPCSGKEERPDEVYTILERYDQLVCKEESRHPTGHPGLLAAGIPPEQLERMAELLAALTPDTGRGLDERLDETYCRLGHLEGLRDLEESLSK